MAQAKEMIEFLRSAVPEGTPLTISSEINILESLGIVSNERAVTAMRTASMLVPPDTPATFKGLVSMLTQLMRMNRGLTSRHKGVLDDAIAEMGQIDDFPLTFGTFLTICLQLMEAQRKREKSSSR